MIPVKNINWVKQNNVNHNEWETLLSINKIILNLNNHNISQSANLIINKIDEIHPITCNIIIIQMICLMFAMKMNDFNIYLNFLNEIEMLEENNNIKSKIFDVFALFLLNQTQELDYLLDKLIEHNFLGKKSNHLLDIFKKTLFKKIPYFVHFMSEKELSTLKSNNFKKQIVDNYEELSKNNWELHKKFIEEGVNTNEIAKIIRNDEIEKLQEISSQNKFDFNQYILPSLYESYSFINQNNVSLIDYAAFFSAVKCFKYLLMNDTKVFNTGKYAVAGGNSEIIHLCEQNHSSFKDAYEAAIEFHRNDIFYYLYDKKIEKNVILENLGVICVRYHNYELFTFLQKEGMNVNDDIILESAKIGNLFFVKNFMKGRKFPTHILLFSLQSGNCELVKYLLEEETESNPLYDYLYVSMQIFFILCFQIIFDICLNYFIHCLLLLKMTL